MPRTCVCHVAEYRYKSKLNSFEDGCKHLHAINILVRSHRTFFLLRIVSKHVGNNHYLEIDASSKEIMSLHDHGIVLLRLAGERSD